MFTDSESFPRELLEQPFERRTGFFKDHKVAHSHLTEVVLQLWS
jgi:hypothetical protein